MIKLSAKRIPENYIKHDDDIMSNFDHDIDNNVAEELKQTDQYAQYSGWNFCGEIWWDKESKKWCCEIWTHAFYRETYESDSLKEIMNSVSEKFGYE
jgi:DNA modification methylase